MKKKIISALLAVMMVLPIIAFTGCATKESEGYITPTNEEPLFDFKSGKTLLREDADPSLNTTFQLVEENSAYELYFSSGILEIALKDKKSGEVWYSNPTPSERNAGIRSEMSSQLTMFYINKETGAQKTLESYIDCLMNEKEDSGVHQYYVVNHNGHLRVIYILGQVRADYIIPTCLEGNAALDYAAKLNDNGYKSEAKYITGGSVYVKLTKKIWDSYPEDRRTELLQIAPKISDYMDEGKDIYVIGDQKKWNNSRLMIQLQEAFVKGAGMTVDERNEINEHFGVEVESAKNFWIPVDYNLTETGLNVSVPVNEIHFDTNTFSLCNINLLPYFGSASRTDNGYMFIPDGSGAIVNFNNGKTNISDAIKLQVYGIEDNIDRVQRPFDNQGTYLPVYGIKKSNSALFAIIEGAAENSTIIADIAGKNTSVIDRNRCYTSFKIYEYDELQFQNASQKSRIFQNQSNTSDISIAFTVLSGEKANYNGMAEYYRNYLIDNGVLQAKKFDSIPFNIELVGAYDHDTAFLGVGYTEMKAITTFDQCKELIQKLSDAGIKNISVNYKGWANNGLRNTVFNKVKVLKALGGNSGIKELQELADSLGVNLYFEAELSYVYKTAAFDGYSQLTDASRMITRDIAHHYQYDLISKLNYETSSSSSIFASSHSYGVANTATLVSPDIIYDIKESSDSKKNSNSNFAKILSDYNELGLKGISLGSLTTNLTGNYKVNNFIDRSNTAKTYAAVAKNFKENLKVMGKGVNAYMLGGVDSIFEISNTSSMFNLADASVPFYQMVIHGCVQYSGEPINLNGDTKNVFLQAVEAGAGVYYRWCYESNAAVQDLVFEGMYSLSYSSWIDEAISTYKEYNELLGSTAGAYITAHESINDDVKKVTYSNGTVVYVNYGASDYVTADGVKVAAKGYAKGGSN